MGERYYKIYQIGFESFNIEITYMTFRNGFCVSRTTNFTFDRNDLNAIVDLLDSEGYDDRSDCESSSGGVVCKDE